jgi:hypothetical protein
LRRDAGTGAPSASDLLDGAQGGELVRKLTPVEKNEYQERTGENVFFATEQEFDETLLALPYEGKPYDQ